MARTGKGKRPKAVTLVRLAATKETDGEAAKKPTPFPTPAVEQEPLSRSSLRLIFVIAGRRFAFEFFSKVTELYPTPARILPFNIHKGKQPPKPGENSKTRNLP